MERREEILDFIGRMFPRFDEIHLSATPDEDDYWTGTVDVDGSVADLSIPDWCPKGCMTTWR